MAANAIISGMIQNQKHRGEDESECHPPIKKADIDLMYESKVFLKMILRP